MMGWITKAIKHEEQDEKILPRILLKLGRTSSKQQYGPPNFSEESLPKLQYHSATCTQKHEHKDVNDTSKKCTSKFGALEAIKMVKINELCLPSEITKSCQPSLNSGILKKYLISQDRVVEIIKILKIDAFGYPT